MFSMLVQVSNVQFDNGRVQDLGHGLTHGGRNLGFHGHFQNDKLQFKWKLEPKSWDWQVGHCTGESGRRVLGEQLRGRSGQAL